MRYHDFAEGDERFYWTDVKPGDLVHSPNIVAYKVKDFVGRDENTRTLFLKHGLLLVLSRLDGCPGESYDPQTTTTFVVWSRHGPLIILQEKRRTL